ncbi:MAG: NAD-dependent epimerase/dehydratase family protein [Bacteroidota bacterium]
MILVTGANGFLGSFICRSLAASGHEVRGLVRRNSDRSLLQNIEGDFKMVEGDILNVGSLEPHFENANTIIHSAAVVSFHKRDFSLMEDVNVQGTKNVVNLALKYNTGYLIHMSSVAAIGRKEKKGIVSETDKWETSKWNSHYGETKYYAELEVWRGIQEGINAVILNPSVVLGPGNWDQSSSRLFKYVWDQNKYYTEGWVNYVDIRDVCTIVARMLELRITNERFIISAGHTSYKELFDVIASDFSKTSPSKMANKWLLKTGLIMETIKSLFTQKRPLITSETINLSETEISFDNSKIKKELNFSFAPLNQTVDWACSQYLSRITKEN